MDKEMLEALSKLLDEKFDEKLNPIKDDIIEMKNDIKYTKVTLKEHSDLLQQHTIMLQKNIDMLQDLETTNANRHFEINEKFKTDTVRIDELEKITKEICYDMTKLKLAR